MKKNILIAFLAMTTVSASVYSYLLKQEVEAERRIAEEQRTIAEQSGRVVEELRLRAEQTRQEALNAAREAGVARRAAEEQIKKLSGR